jgi:prophage maintenance system killer protein
MLKWNGYELHAPESEVVDVAVCTAAHETDVEKVAEFFAAYAEPIAYPEID